MNFQEFQEYFWSYISENVVNNLDRSANNIDFCESVCFDCYRMYEQGMDKDSICKLAENILFNVSRFKPILGMSY